MPPPEDSVEQTLAILRTKAQEFATLLPAMLDFVTKHVGMFQMAIDWMGHELHAARAVIESRERENMLLRMQLLELDAGASRRLACYRLALDKGLKIIPALSPCGGTEAFVRRHLDGTDEIVACLCHADLGAL